jgi:hypothetical protein
MIFAAIIILIGMRKSEEAEKALASGIVVLTLGVGIGVFKLVSKEY